MNKVFIEENIVIMAKKFTDGDRLESLMKSVNYMNEELGLNPAYGWREGLRTQWKSKTLSGKTAPNSILMA